MGWVQLKRGAWTTGAPDDRLDPYLLWADATNFVDFRLEQTRKKELLESFASDGDFAPMLIKLSCAPSRSLSRKLALWQRASKHGPMLKALRMAVLTVGIPAGSRFLTANVNHKFLSLLAKYPELHDLVLRVELCLPVRPERKKFQVEHWEPDGSSDMNPPLVLGVIDDGCPFVRAGIRQSSASTRVKAIWDQSEKPAFDEKTGRADRKELNGFFKANAAGSVDEDASYEAANYDRVRRRVAHGAHVLDVLAGPVPPRNRVPSYPVHPPKFEPESAEATKGDIVFVQLPRTAVQDNSGKWLGVYILDGLRFICSKVPSAGRAVVNISYGPQTGPHDGSSLLEQAIDEAHDLMRIDGRERLQVAMPSGNSFNNRCHANFDLQPGCTEELIWQVPPASEAAAFMEIWMPEQAPLAHLFVELEPPSSQGGDFVSVGVGDMRVWSSTGAPSAAVIFLKQVPQSEKRTMVLLVLAPTNTFLKDRAIAPAGRWKVRVRNECNCVVGPISAQIASNGTDLGASRRGRQSHFSDHCFDPTRFLSEAEDDAKPRVSAIQRRRFLSGIATGEKTHVYSGYRLRDGKFAKYSGSGPSEELPAKNPRWAAVTEESPALVGLRAAGTRSGSTVRLTGTSVASPQGARRLANNDPPKVVPPEDPPFDKARGGEGLAPLP
jgi:hypothetical protein